MTTTEIHEKLKAQFGDAIGPLSEPKIDPFAVVRKDRLVEICRWLKSTAGIEIDHCNVITGVDHPKRNVIEVVYHLFSYRHRHGVVLKVEADRANPSVPSVQGVWKAANWMERETFDLLGVVFEGHPDLRRVLLPDDWVGFPLRKDYQEAGGYHGVSNVRENPLVELRRLDDARKAELAQKAAAAPAAGNVTTIPTAKA
jgi:NADH-quinone oxidoreductase subunit C